jgi:hypothetical protein
VTKQELLDALLAEAVLKLNGRGDIVSVEQALAIAEKARNIEAWRESIRHLVSAGLAAETKPSISQTTLIEAISDAKTMKEQYLNDPYRSPAKCNITSYWHYKPDAKEMLVPSHGTDTITPGDFNVRFSQARQAAVGRGEGFLVGFLEEYSTPESGQITVRIWDASFRSRFLEPIQVSKEQKFAVSLETDAITWTVATE